MIKVNVRTPKEKKTIQVTGDALVRDFKTAVEGEFGTPVENQCLIFGDRILRNEETLHWFGITEGATVNLVVTSESVIKT